MSYAVKELFYTLQGEGANTGRPAVFIRFAGCNLWSGREVDRAKGPGGCSRWCDTDFVGTDGLGGGRVESAAELAASARRQWPESTRAKPLAVCTGGEPLLQLDGALVDALHAAGFEVAIETNGTLPVPTAIDWVCVSPKPGSELKVLCGDELKLVFPQRELSPETFDALDFEHRFIQPMDGPNREENTRLAVEFCLAHPAWRLSLQTHKLVGVR